MNRLLDTINWKFARLLSEEYHVLVSTPDGAVPIIEIKVGDEVLAYNELTGEIDTYTVTHTINHVDAIIIHLYIDGELIETTPEHPFYTDDGVWIDAADLQPGEMIRSLDGDYGVVESVVVIEDANQPMYNLTVDEAHTFFVGDGEWLVHNIKCPIPRAQRAADLSRIADGIMQSFKKAEGSYPNITIAAAYNDGRIAVLIGADDLNDISKYTNFLRNYANANRCLGLDILEPPVAVSQVGTGELHAERLLYQALGSGEKLEIGISNPTGPCPLCDTYFVNKDVAVGSPTREGGIGNEVHIYYKGITSVFDRIFGSY